MTNLAAKLTANQHQRMIDRYTEILNPVMSKSVREYYLKKIEWHTNQHLKKTGQLPK